MKKIQVSVLLMLSLCPITMYAAQASQPDIELGRQVMIDDAVTNFSYLTQGFDFLQTQGVVDTSFHDFLEQNVSHDEREDEEMNFDQVIIKAEDILTKNMKNTFLQTLDTALNMRKSLNQFKDPVFLYVMQHKDNMQDMIHLWLYEWNNNIKNKWDGNSALHFVASSNNVEIASILIDAGADINSQNEYGWTPLHSAFSSNDLKVAKMLIDAGADVNIKTKGGWTPLHYTVCHDKTEAVNMLIAAGADVNIPDVNGETPLYRAASTNFQRITKVKIASILILAGADLSIKNKDGETAEQRARTPEMKVFFAQAREKQQEKVDEQAMARFEKMIRKDWR